MASPGLPEDITAGVTTGHVTDHEKIHDLLNEFDSAAQAQATGDLLVFQDGLIKRLPVGSDGQVLTADSAETAGVKWADASNRHGAVRYGLTAPQTFTSGVNATVIWDDVIFDNDPSNFISLNTSTGVVTFNDAGLYLVICLCLWDNDGSNTTRRDHFLRHLDGGFSFGEGTIAAGRTTQAVAAWYFQQHETMDVRAGQLSGGSLDLLSNPRTSLTIVRISD